MKVDLIGRHTATPQMGEGNANLAEEAVNAEL